MREQSNHMAPEKEGENTRYRGAGRKRNMKAVTAQSPVWHTGPSSDRAQAREGGGEG